MYLGIGTGVWVNDRPNGQKSVECGYVYAALILFTTWSDTAYIY